MTETSFPFKQPASDNPFGKTMSEKQWASGFRYVLDTGIMAVAFNDSLNQCNVTPDPALALTVNVDTGAAFIQGFWYINDAIKSITIPPNNVGGVRADMIVLELQWGLNAGIHAVYITGDNGVVYPSGDPRSGQPMPKQLVTTYGSKWQVPLCQINVPQGANLLTANTVTFIDQRKSVGNGGAQPYAVVVAMGNASDKMRANSDFQVPTTSGYADADSIIMEAFDALPACGGTVMLSEGDCIINGSITPPANSIFAGCGDQTTITLAGTASAMPVIDIAQPGVTVHDMLLEGGGSEANIFSAPAATTGYNGIQVTAANTHIDNVTVNHMKNAGISVEASTISLVTIKDCKINYSLSIGIMYCADWGQVTNNIIWNSGSWGIAMVALAGGQCGANKIQGNSILGTGEDGFHMDGSSSGCGMGFNMISNNLIGVAGQRGVQPWSNMFLYGSGIYNTSLIGNYAWTNAANQCAYGICIKSGVRNTRGIGNDMIDSGTSYDILVESPATFSTLALNLYGTHSP